MANINYCIIYGSVKVYGIGKDVEKFSQWLDFTWQVLRIMNYATLGIFQKLRCNSCPIDANRNRKLALFILTICFKIKSVLQENESLISQNQNLKSEIRKLEREKKRLIDVLSVHETSQDDDDVAREQQQRWRLRRHYCRVFATKIGAFCVSRKPWLWFFAEHQSGRRLESDGRRYFFEATRTPGLLHRRVSVSDPSVQQSPPRTWITPFFRSHDPGTSSLPGPRQ